jgi:hypothetical protein
MGEAQGIQSIAHVGRAFQPDTLRSTHAGYADITNVRLESLTYAIVQGKPHR